MAPAELGHVPGHRFMPNRATAVGRRSPSPPRTPCDRSVRRATQYLGPPASRPFHHDDEQTPLRYLAGRRRRRRTDGVNMDQLLTADELAERLGIKTEWVWAQARAGRIPHVRLGRYRRFRESAVEAWLPELETGGPPTLRNSAPIQPCALARARPTDPPPDRAP